MPENNPSPRKPVPLLPILIVNFIGALGLSIVLPFLVFLVEDFGGNAFIYGIAGAMYPFFQLIGSPLLGRWSDRVGRRKILMISHSGTVLSWIVFGIALFLPVQPLFEFSHPLTGSFSVSWPLIILLVARGLDGLTGGNVAVANAYLADISSEEKRSENFGKMGIASNTGFIFGPALAGLMGAIGYGKTLPVFAALIVSLVGLALILFYLPESKDGSDAADDSPNGNHKVRLRDLPNIPMLLLIYFLVFLGFNFFYTAFPVHAAQGLSWSVTETGLFFTLLSALMVIVQGPILKRLSAAFNEVWLVVAGGFILGTNFLLYLPETLFWTYAATAFFALGNGIMWPSLQSCLSKMAGRHQGLVQGFAGSMTGGASIAGLIAGGFLYGIIGVQVFIFSAGLMYISALLSLRANRSRL